MLKVTWRMAMLTLYFTDLSKGILRLQSPVFDIAAFGYVTNVVKIAF